MTKAEQLDILERAFDAGCFLEVVKMIKANSSIVMIEKVITKSKERLASTDINWDDLFGGD